MELAKLRVLLIIFLNSHINIKIIETIKIIENIITTNKQKYPSFEECSLLTHINPINEDAKVEIDKIKIIISIHFDE